MGTVAVGFSRGFATATKCGGRFGRQSCALGIRKGLETLDKQGTVACDLNVRRIIRFVSRHSLAPPVGVIYVTACDFKGTGGV